MKKLLCGLVCLVLASASAVFATSSFSSDNADIQKGIDLHNAGLTGDLTNIEKSIDLLKPYISKDAIACAYYGSCMTLCAAKCVEDNPIKSLDYLTEGSKYLDESVKMDSKNLMIRLFRLENGIQVSRTSPLKRYAEIGPDVDLLLSSDLSEYGTEIMAEAYLFCGYYKLDAGELDNALDLFDLAIETDAECECGKLAQKMLDKYSE